MKGDGHDYVKGFSVPEAPGGKPSLPPWGKTDVVGERLPRIDGYDRVSGEAVYPSDVHLPGMLHGAILRCPHAHARVKSVDTAAAEGMPGVRAVLTAKSPGAGVDWPYSAASKAKLFDPTCRFEGEAVAAVAAENPYLAWDAVRAIRVEYEVLPFVADEKKALDPTAPEIHPGGNRAGAPQAYGRGDVDKGFAGADVVLEETYRTACELHTPLEPHGCVARWDGRQLTVWESTQGVYPVQARIAEVLGLPLSRVRVIGSYMGGGFGSKLQSDKSSIIAALLARRTGRPVRIFLTREETFLAAGNRPPANMRLKAGARRDGTLTALDFEALCTGGAYQAGGTSLVDWVVRDLYLCPNVRTRLVDVYINAGPARAFRAPGHPQGAWALEQMMDSLAGAIGMDPVEFRLRNIPSVSQAREGNPPYTTTGLRACLEEGARAFGWSEARSRAAGSGPVRRGVGVAACVWAVGGGRPPATVLVKLFPDGSASLNMGASDIGTGTKTVMAMVVSEELDVPIERIQIELADTGTTQYATASGGSKTVPTEAPAVRAAAVHARQQLLEMAARDLKADPSDLSLAGDQVVFRKDPGRRLRLKEISALQAQGLVLGVGYRAPNPENRVVNPFGAQFCEVEVDTRTGEMRILRVLAAQDSGRVMNRLTYDNQTFGGITMGIGLAMTEARVLDGSQTGKMVNRNWHDYKLPTMLDVPPEMTTHPVDLDDREANSTGAKGLGEPVTIPTAPAIANAVCHATGLRVRETPLSPARLGLLLAEQGKKG